jgi:negative regulator of genetic competence, sporulation and motility
MNTEIILQHVAIQYPEKKKAEMFFTKVLELSIVKTFTVSEELSKQIFGISEDVEVVVYGNNNTKFEVFITQKKSSQFFEHICIEVENKDDFVKKCKKYGLKPFFVKKGERDLLFVRDFAENLYEIKEKQS